MKKLLLSMIVLLFVIQVQAQEDANWCSMDNTAAFPVFKVEQVLFENLYYNIIEDGAQVTYEQPELGIPAYSNYPDTIIIPSQVEINGVIYPVVSIGENAFQCCWDLKAVVIPNTVTTIGDYAFYSDNQIEGIVLPDHLVRIGKGSFLGTGITSIGLPNTLASIGIQAFSFTPLHTISIPQSVTEIGEGVCLISWGLFSDMKFPIDASGNTYTIEPQLDSIYWYADSCSLIQNSPWSITYPFANNFSYVVIGDNVRVIPQCCFATTGNDTITIPEQVTFMHATFNSCPNLKWVNFNAKRCPRAIYPFWHCGALETVIFGDSVRIIPEAVCADGEYMEDDHPHISTVVLGNSVETIGSLAFGNNVDLESITIPPTVKYIDQNAFANCTSLKRVYMEPDIPPVVLRGAFHYNAEDRTFIVQCQNYESYYNAEGWDSCYFESYSETFMPLVEYRNSLWSVPESPYQFTILSNDTIMGKVRLWKNASTCDATAIYFAEANEGYHLDHWSTGATCNPDTLVVTGDTIVTAYFAKDQYRIDGVAATSIIFTDFEDPEQDTLWRLKNEDYVNKWYITDLDSVNSHYFAEPGSWDLLVENRGRALFISNDDGQSNDYYNNNSDDFSYVFAYCPMNLDTGTYYGSFDWRCYEILTEEEYGWMEEAMMQDDLFTTFLYGGDVNEIPLADTTDWWSSCMTPDCCMGYDWKHYLSNSVYTQYYIAKDWTPTDQYFQREYFNTKISSEGNYNLLYYWRNGSAWLVGSHLYSNGLPAAVDNVLFGKQDPSGGSIVGADVLANSFDTLTLTAVANPGYRFVCWYDFDTNPIKQVVATSNLTCVAFFEKNGTGVNEWSDQIIEVFPNPVRKGQNVNLDLPNDEKVQVEIINALGVVEVQHAMSLQTPKTLKAPNTPGVYILRITVEGKGMHYRKLLVE